ncbi:type I-E CRISPR-associated protein Cse1/CasA [Pseudodesulfovibrio senegalensis]|uniref:Type I-E CRISPR-associated protein Cse1/CasA n=1 Tax=Pseudodesulfovibrio senegalensis TaxID=1721087 RepID=A0A6N6N490_9BACT|nr:type I-E CRISPR-associated protein Cse1/CasA [Pseudodesulfovibrio senegalensis]KAB1442874.1 type I-E CRISPR-associated protein Cse1/CasA [Pseudodesulfovibrio senegalensis]
MKYNLLDEPWLPALFGDGRTEWIRPWEIVGDDPPVGLNPQRADFRAALMEFLVGLLQTAFAPADIRARDRMLDSPPGQEALREAFEAHREFFNLFGERPRFMQDLTMNEADKPKLNKAAFLFIEQPGDNTEKKNKDLFVKRGLIKTLCPACAASALYTMQVFSPAGGRGLRTSMRGGGPLSTLCAGDTLWQSLWLNVAPANVRQGGIEPASGREVLASRVYAWAAPTRTSDKNEQVHPQDMHPLHAFWGMPRRIVLREEAAQGPCHVCGREHELAVREFLSRPNGYNYGPEWVHPLTPYTMEQGKPPLSIKGRSNIDAYSNWLGVVYGEPNAKRHMHAALCVHNAGRRGGRIGVAGYDMANDKARQWCEHVFPSFALLGDEATFGAEVRGMVAAADQVRRNLLGALKDALVHEAGKNQAKTDMSLFENANNMFWGRTEATFYDNAARLAALPDRNASLSERDELRLVWGRVLLAESSKLFEEIAERFGIPPERMERCVEAHRRMKNYNIKHLRGMEMYPPREA